MITEADKRAADITYEECQARIDKVNGVCSGCGREIKPLKTVNNANEPTYWAGCEKCSKFCWGVDRNIYKAARKLVVGDREKYYNHLGSFPLNKHRNEKWYWYTANISGMVGLLHKAHQYMQPERARAEAIEKAADTLRDEMRMFYDYGYDRKNCEQALTAYELAKEGK